MLSDPEVCVDVSSGRCVRVFVGGMRVRDGVDVAVAVGVEVNVGVRLAVGLDAIRTVDGGRTVIMGVLVKVGAVVKVCVGSRLLVDVAPPVLGIISSASSPF